MGDNLLHGLTSLGNGPATLYLFAGALIGTIVGAIPGLSTVVILSIILVFSYHIDLVGTLCLFLGAQAGSYYSGSITAILLNTPAHPEAFAITFDGYPMARKGQPGRALGISAASTCIGGFIGSAILIAFIPIINDLPGLFHAPEYVGLVTLAMLMVGTLGTDSTGKAIAAAGAGLLLASVGPSIITGQLRYSFGALGLYDGISLVALALGVFAIPQMVMIFGTASTVARQDMTGQEIGVVSSVEISKGFGKQLWAGVRETFRHWGILIQSGIVGGLTGIIPGIGGFTGNFMAYAIARQTSRKRDLYGTGIPEGIIAPEGSSLAKEAGHIIPIVGLGIPGGVGGALFIAALTIKGIKTGYGFTTTFPLVTYQIGWILALSGLIGTVAGVLLGPQLAKVTRVPGPILVPFILAMSIVGPFLVDVQFFAVIEVLIFGVIGLALRRLRYPLGSFVLGLVLGPTFETNVYLTHNVYPGFSFIAKRPSADAILLVTIGILVSKSLELHRRVKKAKADLAAEIAHIDDESLRAAAIRAQQLRSAPYPLLALLTTLFLLGSSTFAIVYGSSNYRFATAIMPVIGGLLVALPTAWFLPRDIYRYVSYRKFRAERVAVPSADVALSSGAAGSATDASGLPSMLDMTQPAPELLASTGPAISHSADLPPIRDKSWGMNGQYLRELVAFGCLAGLVVLVWLFGFVWGISVFMALYGLGGTGRVFRTLKSRLIFTVLSTAAVWVITVEMFHLTHLAFAPRITF